MSADPERIRAHFRTQAAACARLGSPFTAALLEGLAERMAPESAIEARLLSWPGDPRDDALALRAAGALHALARDGRDAEVSAAWPPRAGLSCGRPTGSTPGSTGRRRPTRRAAPAPCWAGCWRWPRGPAACRWSCWRSAPRPG